jgi:hypothetical protein
VLASRNDPFEMKKSGQGGSWVRLTRLPRPIAPAMPDTSKPHTEAGIVSYGYRLNEQRAAA